MVNMALDAPATCITQAALERVTAAATQRQHVGMSAWRGRGRGRGNTATTCWQGWALARQTASAAAPALHLFLRVAGPVEHLERKRRHARHEDGNASVREHVAEQHDDLRLRERAAKPW
jgi:hypothetical protein